MFYLCLVPDTQCFTFMHILQVFLIWTFPFSVPTTKPHGTDNLNSVRIWCHTLLWIGFSQNNYMLNLHNPTPDHSCIFKSFKHVFKKPQKQTKIKHVPSFGNPAFIHGTTDDRKQVLLSMVCVKKTFFIKYISDTMCM